MREYRLGETKVVERVRHLDAERHERELQPAVVLLSDAQPRQLHGRGETEHRELHEGQLFVFLRHEAQLLESQKELTKWY